MKVIHTFARGKTSGTLPFVILANAIVSATYAKEHYGNIELYVDKPAYQSFVNCFGDDLPYDKIHILESDEDLISTWSIPKLKVFAMQKEPYLHIDLDTIFYKKYDFVNKQVPFLFSHIDVETGNPSSTFQDGINEMLIKGEGGLPSNIAGLYDTYLYFLFRTLDSYPKEYFKYFDCTYIPNMNIIYIEQPEVMAEASRLSLEIYDKHKQLFDGKRTGPCFVEQLLLHWFLRVLSPEYRKLSDNQKHVIFNQEPFQPGITGTDITQYEYCVLNTPDTKFVNLSNSISSNGKVSDIKTFIKCDFGGFFHSTGYKSNPYVEANILYALGSKLGDRVLEKLHRFTLMHRYNDKAPYLSEGQKIYQEYINSEIFDLDTKEFESAEKNLNLKLV